MTVEEVRNLFPHIKKGKIYFNNAATGAFSTKVLESVNNYLLQRTETDIENYQAVINTLNESKKYLCKMLNCAEDRIAFLDNTSNGMNLLAQGLNWKKGDGILLNDIEFPANVYPFLNLQSQGVEIDFVKAENGIVTADDIIRAVKPNTKLISVSFVQFLSGYRIDLEKIGSFCKEREIIFSVDAIQGLGAFTLDILRCKFDFISCGTSKWLLGMQGLAFIFCSKQLQERINPKYVGWTSVENAWNILNYDLQLKKTADAFQTGTLNSLGIFGLLPSLKLFWDFGYQNVENRILENAEYFNKKLLEINIHPVLENCGSKNLSGVTSFRHEKAKFILEELMRREIYCSVREGMVRLSPHFFNTLEEIDRVVSTIKNILNVSLRV